MSKIPLYQLTSGRSEETFDEAGTMLQSLGFRQSVFEVERLEALKGRQVSGAATGEVIVLRPSARQDHYDLMKPGDKVQCLGLKPDAVGSPAICRILRMAEGISSKTMIERV